MIEEILNKKDQEETNKIFNVIHKQAYWKNKEIENKRMLQNIEKELKKDKIKEFKANLIEDSINFVLFVAMCIPTIMLLVVLCY